MRVIFENVLIAFFLIFQGLLPNIIAMPAVYSYWDEAFVIVLLLLFVIKNFHTVKGGRLVIRRENWQFFAPWLGIIAVGLIGNIIFRYTNSAEAIIRDIVGCLKFMGTFFLMRELRMDIRFSKSLVVSKLGWVKCSCITIFACGIISLFYDIGMGQNYDVRHGIIPFQFLYDHPTALVAVGVFMLCLFRVYGNCSLYEILSLLIIVLAMRTKGFAFVAVYVFLRYGRRWLSRWKIVYWVAIVGVAFGVGYQKLALLASFSSSGREVLWTGAFQLMKMCFPVGSGFGTFASHVSGKYRSSIYDFIISSEFFYGDGSARAVLGDTGFPYYMGQFGVIGVILIVYSVINLRRIWADKSREINFAADTLGIYLLIALTTESILVNQGVEFAVVLALVICIDKLRKTEDIQEILPNGKDSNHLRI